MPISNTKILAALAVSAAVAASGCGMIKNLDDMHNATNDMSNTTKGMAQSVQQTNDGMNTQIGISEQLNNRTAEMADQTEALYTDQRQGFSDQIRHQFLDAMEGQHEMEAKLGEAGQYFMAFEFQLYKHFGADTEAKRDSLYQQATEEFFRVARRYINDDYDIDPSTDDSDQLNAAALAVTMYRINPNLQNSVAVADDEKVSMLDLIERTLAKKSKLESGELREEDLKEYEREIFRKEQDAVYLLQLRTNFIGGIVLADISDVHDRSIFTLGWRMLFGWDLDLDAKLRNNEQIVTNTTYIKDAIRERDFLKSLNYNPRLDGNLMKLYRKMKMRGETVAPANATLSVRIHDQDMKALVDGINEYRK